MNNKTNGVNKNTVIVGIDTHKYTHTAVLINSYGQTIDNLNFDNTSIDKLEEKIKTVSSNNIFLALEDTEYFGKYIAKYFSKQSNLSIRHVPSYLTRRHRGRKSKNDFEDALSVAKTVLFDFESTLPLKVKYTQQNKEEQLKVLQIAIKEREELVKDIVALKNKLHALLHMFYATDEILHPLEKRMNKSTSLLKIQENLKQKLDEKDDKAGILLYKTDKLLFMQSKLKEIDIVIDKLSLNIEEVKALKEGIYGCGVLLASTIVCEVGDIDRFKSEAHFASYAATTPKERSSASRKRFVMNKVGNKTLNKALHIIALAQISKSDSQGRVYFDKKLSEGKSKLWAIRCLKRQIARKVYKTLTNLN